jgi:hypothetical protein
MKARVYSTYAECFGDFVEFHTHLKNSNSEGYGLCPNIEYKLNGDTFIEFPISELNYDILPTELIVNSIMKITDGQGAMTRNLEIEHYEFDDDKYPSIFLNVKWLRANAKLIRKEQLDWQNDNYSVIERDFYTDWTDYKAAE